VLKAQPEKHPFSLIEEEIARFLRGGWVEMIRKVFCSGFYDNCVRPELLIIPSFLFFLLSFFRRVANQPSTKLII